MRTTFALLATVVALLAGAAADANRDLDALRTAQSHLSAVLTVQRFARFTYGLSPEAGHLPVVEEPEPHGEGAQIQRFRYLDARGRVLGGGYVIQQPDLSFRTHIRFPDGLTEDVVGKAGDFRLPPDPKGKEPFGELPQRFDIVHRLSTGDVVRYCQELELQEDLFGAFPINITSTGELRLGSGQTVRFTLCQPRPLELTGFTDQLDVRFGGGERLRWEVPVGLDELPLLDQPAAGTFTAQGRAMRFELTGTGRAGEGGSYNRWSLGDRRGLNGVFLLNPDFSGQGRAQRRRSLEFVGRWSPSARGNLLLADGQLAAAGPSAGAQALGNLRFSGMVVAYGPAPGLR